MAPKILILASPGDLHSFAVAEALRRKGSEAVLWQTTDFPTRSGESFLFEAGSSTARAEGLAVDLSGSDLTTVWRRRPAHSLDATKLHPEDLDFANLECSIFRRSFLASILPRAFWVNPPEAAIRANQKLIQHRVAIEVGWKMPDTLYGNDPAVIRAFIEAHGGRIVYKTLQGSPAQSGEDPWVHFTRALTPDALVSDELLRTTPGIYQELVPKAYELRATVMGRSLLAVRILSQQTEAGRLDWRQSESRVQMEPWSLDPATETLCYSLLDRLGLTFGCIDLIVTPGGETLFLEVNEMGQFLFLEQRAGVPLLDAFSDFLLRGESGFRWVPGPQPVLYSEVAGEAEHQAAESLAHHVPPPR